MTADLKIESLDFTVFNRRMYELNQALIGTSRPGAAANVLKDECRLFLKEVIAKTPPKSLAQGRNAIKQDILGGRTINAAGKKSLGILFRASPEVIQNAQDRGDKALLWTNKKGEVYGVEKTLFKPNISQGELKIHHRKYKQPSSGRASLGGNFTRDVGRWKFIKRMVAPTASVNLYVANEQKKVGRLKGSWAASYQALGGRVVGWVAKHLPSPKAIQANPGTLNGDKPFLEFGSRSPGNNRHVTHAVKRALYVRSGKIKSKIKREIQEYADAIRERRPIRSQYKLEDV